MSPFSSMAMLPVRHPWNSTARQKTQTAMIRSFSIGFIVSADAGGAGGAAAASGAESAGSGMAAGSGGAAETSSAGAGTSGAGSGADSADAASGADVAAVSDFSSESIFKNPRLRLFNCYFYYFVEEGIINIIGRYCRS